MSDTDNLINEFIDLTIEKREIEAKLTPVKERLDELRKQVATAMRERGDQSITRGGWRISMSRDMRVSVIDKRAMRDFLMSDPGGQHVVQANAASLKLYLSERMTLGKPSEWEPSRFPKDLHGLVDVGEYYKATCTKRSYTKGE